MKFLAPAHAGLAPFAALALGVVWSVRWIGPPVASALLVVATLSGGLDVLKIAAARIDVPVFSKADLEYAARVREKTPRHSTILTAPTHNHPVLLSGRRLFFGYEGHLWSQGLTFTQRKADAEAVLHGDLERLRNAVPPIDAMAWTLAEAGAIPNRADFEALPSWVDSPYRLLKIR